MIKRHFAVFQLLSPHRRLPFFVTAAVLSLAAEGISEAACPVADASRPYIEEIVSKLVFDAAFVTANVHVQDRGFALSLFGVDQAVVGQLLLAHECTKPEVFQPFYEHFDRGRTSRLQLECEARGVEVIKLAVASTTQETLSAFHFLHYDATRYPGEVVYRPYPSVDWRTIKFADGNFSVSAAVFRRLIFTPSGGTPVDLTHFGSLSGRVINDQPTGSSVYALFPSVTAGAQPLVVNVHVNEHGIASGSVRASGETLARISGTGFQSAITWQGQCASAGP